MKTGLKVLMISTDRKLFEQGSDVRERIKLYASVAEEIHIIVYAVKSLGLENQKIESNVWVYPTNSINRWFYALNAVKLGKKLVVEKKFVRGQSLITTQDPFECGWAGLKIKKKWRLPLEVQLHTDPFTTGFSGSLNTIRKRLLNKIIPKADSVRVVSQYIGGELVRRYKIDQNKISVLPVFVNKDKVEGAVLTFDLHARFGWQFVLLTVSRLTQEKNLPLALQVLSLLRQRYPSVGLVIVGAGPEEKSLKLQVKSLKLEHNVVFEGWQENLASYYKTANVYIQTSHFEGYGMSLVEAGLSGLPVVTTPVGIANDIEDGKEAYVCPQDDAGYFANAIADLLENNQKRQNLAINMKSFLREHLLSKEQYLDKLKKNWELTAKAVS